MRTLIKLAVGLLFLALIGMLVWRGFSVREPSYQGRSMSVWLEDYNRAGAVDKTGPVDEAIRAMGTNTLPHLLAHLKRKDSPLKRRLFLLAEKHHLAFFPPPRRTPFLSPATTDSISFPRALSAQGVWTDCQTAHPRAAGTVPECEHTAGGRFGVILNRAGGDSRF